MIIVFNLGMSTLHYTWRSVTVQNSIPLFHAMAFGMSSKAPHKFMVTVRGHSVSQAAFN